MCGICGYYNLQGGQASETLLRKMCGVITHRGPDDEGTHIDGAFGMGMRRLSIIDLNTGHQPMSNEDGSIWTVFNGEIYNYVELTEVLKKKGHVFSTHSDTETIVHLYEEYGMDFVKHLRGMFGLAVWDARAKTLVLARDPLGIKQLYFSVVNDTFIFGSEIKCILACGTRTFGVNHEALHHFLTFLYIPDNLTICDGIEKMRPGTVMRVAREGIRTSEYWNLNHVAEVKIGFEDARARCLELMKQSVKLHLRSDVPLGVFLSGGLDSSMVTALAAGSVPTALNTYTVGYGAQGSFYDERSYAKIVAERFKTAHHEYTISGEIQDTLQKLIRFFDQPFANSSAIPNYHIARMMSKELKVALSGLGGDEIAGGYERILGMKMLLSLRAVPPIVKKSMQALVNILPDSRKGKYFNNRIKRFVRAAQLTPENAYFSIISAVTEEEKATLLKIQPGRSSYDLFSDTLRISRQEDFIRAISYFDIVSYMPNDLLTLTDITSMANSLEVRVPLLDQDLVEFMFSVPFEYKIRGTQKKYLFQSAFKDILPHEILHRKKRGFSTPLSVWLREDMREFVQSVFTRERIEATEVLNAEGIHSLLNKHFSLKENYQGVLFALLTFILWHEDYIQNK